MLDFENITWSMLEHEFRREYVTAPVNPFSQAKDGSFCLFLNSKKYKPQRAGIRMLVAAQWVMVHIFLAKSRTWEKGVSSFSLANHFSLKNFYPSIQKAAMDSMQSVLPVRVKANYVVDAPMVFNIMWKVASLWVSEKMANRLRVVGFSDLPEYIDKSAYPSYLKGDLDESAIFEDWLAHLKEFYEATLQPIWTEMVKDEEKSVPDMDHWHPNDKVSKKREKGKERKEREEGEKLINHVFLV
eukprot:TRINITY_DN5440_c0_g1_i4.p1 TRINITY_DN5440_c0_g1~~TRINITY_DN5440_c0_g1_i4.p1  ORF type:complete len:242 (+),score=45.19 TRINITY_DN5440_c0_g1_i4:111-836(+)